MAATLTNPYQGRVRVTIEYLDDPTLQSQGFEFPTDPKRIGIQVGAHHHHMPLIDGFRQAVIDSVYTGTTLVISTLPPMVAVALAALEQAQDKVGFGR